VVDRYVAAMDAQDAGVIRTLFTSDAVISLLGRQIASGQELIDTRLELTFHAMPTARREVVDRLTNGEFVADLERITMWGRSEEGLVTYQVSGGCIVRMDVLRGVTQ
jgi:hypothetical protein